MAKQRPKGMIFVSYAHNDRKRVEPLVNFLASRFNLWWDRKIELGESWRQTLMHQLDSARCVIVVWTNTSVEREFIWSEVERVKDRGVIVPVKLDKNAKIPLGFDKWQHLDLSSWSGKNNKSLQTLVDRIKNLLARPRRVGGTNTLATDTWVVNNGINATDSLVRLSDEIRSITGVLSKEAGPTKDLLGALKEVEKTYLSTSMAIRRFIKPAVGATKINIKPYLEMERGTLVTLISNNSGHCSRIMEYYIRVGGLRDWLAPRLTSEKLKTLDEVFRNLGTADGDLFAELARVADVLTEEAISIVGLLLSGQERLVRDRILEGRRKLLPLERSLVSAMAKLQQIGSSLGYVSKSTNHKS